MFNALLFLFGLIGIMHNVQAVIVYLQGTGSAGKSSLCKELLRSDSSWKVVDEDAMYIEQSIQYFKEAFSEEFQCIETAIAHENIFHAIKRNQILFQDTATAQQKTEARIAIYSMRTKLDELTARDMAFSKKYEDLVTDVLNCTRAHAQQRFNVVVDSWLLTEEHLEMLKKEDAVVQVMAYCPFKDLVNRTIQRNAHALLNRNLYAMRYYHHALTSFMKLYDFEEKQSDQSIDVITREEMSNALDVVQLSLSSQENIAGFSRAEFSQGQLHEYHINCMKKFANHDVLYVVPKNNIDAFIRTDKVDASEAAQQLLIAVKSVAI